MSKSPKLRWKPIQKPVADRLEAVLSSWLNTPYAAGHRAKRIATDCLQYVAGVLDELYNRPEPTFVSRLPSDTAIHNPRRAIKAVRSILLAFPADVVRDGTVQPGDIVVTRAELQSRAENRQAHALVVGSRPWSAYHAVPRIGVVRTSLAALPIVRIYRPKDKHLWQLH